MNRIRTTRRLFKKQVTDDSTGLSLMDAVKTWSEVDHVTEAQGGFTITTPQGMSVRVWMGRGDTPERVEFLGRLPIQIPFRTLDIHGSVQTLRQYVHWLYEMKEESE